MLSPCDTGGELAQTLVNLNHTYYLDMPNGDDIEVDDDNDCLYLLSPWSGGHDFSIIENCAFASGKDDGIDHNKANVYARWSITKPAYVSATGTIWGVPGR